MCVCRNRFGDWIGCLAGFRRVRQGEYIGRNIRPKPGLSVHILHIRTLYDLRKYSKRNLTDFCS
ncbi:hypothetical protein DCAR_0309844 [Daucus carota subsp. sativus]|uniref:Uncharacterized protein n=1 Tax=Daucus carota subsp. sativus TaxID=79200 RepID=A0A165ZF96_DAUCS|nr:hypothetical protein DCAR_0309844 [Daucus carota subsp. sativus]